MLPALNGYGFQAGKPVKTRIEFRENKIFIVFEDNARVYKRVFDFQRIPNIS